MDDAARRGAGSDYRFPMACESCGKITAMPFMAGTSIEKDSIRVGMRCRECGHEWKLELPNRDIGFDPIETK